jgi:hypothetical protein
VKKIESAWQSRAPAGCGPLFWNRAEGFARLSPDKRLKTVQTQRLSVCLKECRG